LQPYSIFQRRKTTINHAFASALAPNDLYDDELVSQAVRDLGQDPEADLRCVYCDERPAQTWDHVSSLVKDGKYAGYGHVLGNLLPSCQQCNSRKGGKDWREFLDTELRDDEKRSAKVALLEAYLRRYRPARYSYDDINELLPREVERLQELQRSILALMQESDTVAREIRDKVRAHLRR
jgi:hypothetical protein